MCGCTSVSPTSAANQHSRREGKDGKAAEGTLSLLIPVKDNGRSHLIATWGGTALTRATPPASLQAYVDSAGKAGEPHPFLTGKDSVRRYMTVVEEVGRAALAVPRPRSLSRFWHGRRIWL